MRSWAWVNLGFVLKSSFSNQPAEEKPIFIESGVNVEKVEGLMLNLKGFPKFFNSLFNGLVFLVLGQEL